MKKQLNQNRINESCTEIAARTKKVLSLERAPKYIKAFAQSVNSGEADDSALKDFLSGIYQGLRDYIGKAKAEQGRQNSTARITVGKHVNDLGESVSQYPDRSDAWKTGYMLVQLDVAAKASKRFNQYLEMRRDSLATREEGFSKLEKEYLLQIGVKKQETLPHNDEKPSTDAAVDNAAVHAAPGKDMGHSAMRSKIEKLLDIIQKQDEILKKHGIKDTLLDREDIADDTEILPADDDKKSAQRPAGRENNQHRRMFKPVVWPVAHKGDDSSDSGEAPDNGRLGNSELRNLLPDYKVAHAYNEVRWPWGGKNPSPKTLDELSQLITASGYDDPDLKKENYAVFSVDNVYAVGLVPQGKCGYIFALHKSFYNKNNSHEQVDYGYWDPYVVKQKGKAHVLLLEYDPQRSFNDNLHTLLSMLDINWGKGIQFKN